MTNRIHALCAILLASAALAAGGCRGQRGYPHRPILLVCPWAAGGGTDRVSREVAALMEQELGVPVDVVNATGGAGVTGHTRGALARPDGYTLTMVTVEINMMRWQGLTSISCNDYDPVGLINRDAAAIFVRGDAPWTDIGQLADYVRQNPGRLKSSGTAQGGIWHLAFAGWLDRIGARASDAIWVSINGSAPSLQELIAGGVDVVCCSLPEAQSLLEAGRVRCLGVMAEQRVPQFPDVPTLREQGIDWSLGGWRGVCLPKHSPPEVRNRLTEALQHVVRSDEFGRFMRQAGFDVTWQPPAEFAETMRRVDAQLGGLLQSDAFRSIQRRQFGPMFFPVLLGALLVAVLLALAVSGGLRRPPGVEPLSRRGVVHVAEVIAWVVAYVALAEWAGFVPTAAVLLVLLMVRFGARPWLAAAVSAAVVPATYYLFAVALRVPLPQGWLDW